MSSRTLLVDLGGARVYLQTDPHSNRNEIMIDEVQGRPPDAIAVRFGVWLREDGSGRPIASKISYDFLQGNDTDIENAPRRSERMMFELADDDDPSAAPNAAILKIYDQEQPVGQETDKDERLMLALSKAKGLELYVPLNAYAGILRGGVEVGVAHRFNTDHGRFVINWQDDEGIPAGDVYDTWDVNKQPRPESEWGSDPAAYVGRIQFTPK